MRAYSTRILCSKAVSHDLIVSCRAQLWLILTGWVSVPDQASDRLAVNLLYFPTRLRCRRDGYWFHAPAGNEVSDIMPKYSPLVVIETELSAIRGPARRALCSRPASCDTQGLT